ncbi:DUF4142 domain-containing protein [Anatilimnocola floriformis]|uniref:DUF4142 domain-containing protein n=1 Tax=Anatilimnocola floriformis TaxID=2948575 RepID=UPI0020C24770|nr:DUF4142 domain-containing protein [Anatilimnocola floriformis]
MRNAGWLIVVMCLVGGSSMVHGQTAPPRSGVQPAVQLGAVRPGQPVQNAAGQQQHGDQEIAHMIVGGNRNEIEIAKFAMDRLKSNDAKEIATTMIKDHTEALNKFSKFAGQQPAHVRNNGNPRTDDDRADAAPPAGSAPTAARPGVGTLNWSAIGQEICDQGLEDCKKELSRYEGADFDKAYLGSQLGAHHMMCTKLKVLKKHASSQLATEIDEAIETTETHIKHLRKAMDEVKDK